MKQMLFDGVEPERARELATAWTEATSYVDQGKTYETYEERYCPILDVPEIKRAGQGKMSRESYLAAQGHPMGWDDPKPLIARIRCPLLVIFGQLDSQVDPVAGAKDWEICLRNAKHPDFTVKTIASANHGIWKAKTGSYSELMSLLNDQRYVYPDEYMAIINEWLLNRFGTERRRYAGTNAGDGQ